MMESFTQWLKKHLQIVINCYQIEYTICVKSAAILLKDITFEVAFDSSSSSRFLRFRFRFLFGSSKRKQNCLTFAIHVV